MKSESNGKSSAPLSSDPNSVLHIYDTSSGMYSYVMKQAWMGTAIGTGTSAAAMYFIHRRSSLFRRYTNYPVRAFFLFAGAAVGFNLASDWAMVRYHRSILPSTGTHMNKEESEAMLERARISRLDMVKSSAWENRFRLIGGVWALTMGAVMWRNFNNPLLAPVHKFGHARIAAQAVTLMSIVAVFYFNEETGPNAKKYKSED